MKLSIIIPVYNVEEYIEKCILSLQDQDIPHSDYEIIIINDGSPDNSREVIIRLAAQYNNIVFIEQENKGVSQARNTGIDRAKGRYIVFIDPDDYVMPNSFSEILESADVSNAEVVFLGYTFLNSDNSVRKEILFKEETGKVYPGIMAYHISRGDGNTDPDRSWAVLFERDFINWAQLSYLANVPYLEDGEFIARVMCLAERCIFNSKPFYIRTTRPGSATNSDVFYSDKAINGFIKAAENLVKFQQNIALTPVQREFLNQPVCKFILLAVNSSLKKKNSFSQANIKAILKAKGLIKCNLKGCNKYYRRAGFFFNISTSVYAVYRPVWSLIDRLYFSVFKVHP